MTPIVARDDRKPYTPAPPGLHNAVCVDVVDLGLIDSPWGEKPQIELRWQLERENPETGKPFLVVRRFTLSLSEKSNLRPFLEGWLGAEFSDEEAKGGVDLESFVGMAAFLQVIHQESSKGQTFANVKTALPGQRPIEPRDYVRKKDRGVEEGGAA